MPTPGEAARNVNAAVAAAQAGDLGRAFQVLRQGREASLAGASTSPGDELHYPQGGTAVGDNRQYPPDGLGTGDDSGYPSVGYPDDDQIPGWYPYEPPFGQQPLPPDPNYPVTPPSPPSPPAGWYPDPFDGNGKRYWNGSGWTELQWG